MALTKLHEDMLGFNIDEESCVVYSEDTEKALERLGLDHPEYELDN